MSFFPIKATVLNNSTGVYPQYWQPAEPGSSAGSSSTDPNRVDVDGDGYFDVEFKNFTVEFQVAPPITNAAAEPTIFLMDVHVSAGEDVGITSDLAPYDIPQIYFSFASGLPDFEDVITDSSGNVVSSYSFELTNILYASNEIDGESNPVSTTFERLNPSGIAPWRLRNRRVYGDYISHEIQELRLVYESNSSPVVYYTGIVSLNGCPTCRSPDDPGGPAVCFDPSLYNVIDINDLAKYAVPREPCEEETDPSVFPLGRTGRPIDIDVVRGHNDFLVYGENDTVPSGIIMYYSPFTNTVPVIDNFVYNTFDVPPPPAGKINIFKILEADTRNEVRDWTCAHLKFATITNLALWGSLTSSAGSSASSSASSSAGSSASSSAGSSASSSAGDSEEFIGIHNAIKYNWPYNDLYFTDGCPAYGDTVNLVPC